MSLQLSLAPMVLPTVTAALRRPQALPSLIRLNSLLCRPEVPMANTRTQRMQIMLSRVTAPTTTITLTRMAKDMMITTILAAVVAATDTATVVTTTDP